MIPLPPKKVKRRGGKNERVKSRQRNSDRI